MRNLARRDSGTPEVQFASLALPNPYALERWLRRAWRIVDDPVSAEYVRAPSYILECGRLEGDCDDAATLAASILHAQMIPAQFVAIRRAGEQDFSHVFIRVPAYQLDIDPIVPVEHLPVHFVESMVVYV